MLTIEKGGEMLKSQIEEAKKRRDMKYEAEEKKKILWTFKKPLIKYVRNKRLLEKLSQIEQQQIVRQWCIRIKVLKVF